MAGRIWHTSYEQAADLKTGAVVAVTVQTMDGGGHGIAGADAGRCGEAHGRGRRELEAEPGGTEADVCEPAADPGESGESGCCGGGARRWSARLHTCWRRRGLRRVHVRGQEEIRKRILIQAAAFNLGLLMRKRFGAGTPRGLQGLAAPQPRQSSSPLCVIAFTLPLRLQPFTKLFSTAGTEGADLAWSTGLCAVTTLPWFKAAKVIRNVAKAIRARKRVRDTLQMALGAFFCSDMFLDMEDYLKCRMDSTDVGSQTLQGQSVAGDHDLARMLEDVADISETSEGVIPDEPPLELRFLGEVPRTSGVS